MADSPFRPTRAPAGRLARLGVALDPRNPPNRARLIAVMCERAGLDALWATDLLPTPSDEPGQMDALTALRMAATSTTRISLGVVLDVAKHESGALRDALGELHQALGDRLEVALAGDDSEAVAACVSALGWSEPGARRPILGVELRGPGHAEVAARLADTAYLPAALVETVRLAIEDVWRACERVGRDAGTLGLGVQMPVSVGRTFAEAQARATNEPLFGVVGQPAEVGIFGTLEECQDRVIELAHLGIADLRCVVPNSPDVHDVIAQLRPMAVGTVNVLAPGAPRSEAPPPPENWGGRRPR